MFRIGLQLVMFCLALTICLLTGANFSDVAGVLALIIAVDSYYLIASVIGAIVKGAQSVSTPKPE